MFRYQLQRVDNLENVNGSKFLVITDTNKCELYNSILMITTIIAWFTHEIKL